MHNRNLQLWGLPAPDTDDSFVSFAESSRCRSLNKLSIIYHVVETAVHGYCLIYNLMCHVGQLRSGGSGMFIYKALLKLFVKYRLPLPYDAFGAAQDRMNKT